MNTPNQATPNVSVEVRALRKSFRGQEVLKGINLKIAPGQIFVIMGPSGSGKSILLKHLIGLITPDAGEIHIDGQKITGMDERQLLQVRRKFGMLFQGAALFDSLNVEDNVGFLLRREGRTPPPEIARRVGEVLDLVGLEGTQKKMPAELSGGMRKRVGLARPRSSSPCRWCCRSWSISDTTRYGGELSV